jgi:hypothetical protein
VWCDTKLMMFMKLGMNEKRGWREVRLVLKKVLKRLCFWFALTATMHKQHSNNESTVHCRSLRIHDYIAGLRWWLLFDRPTGEKRFFFLF